MRCGSRELLWSTPSLCFPGCAHRALLFQNWSLPALQSYLRAECKSQITKQCFATQLHQVYSPIFHLEDPIVFIQANFPQKLRVYFKLHLPSAEHKTQNPKPTTKITAPLIFLLFLKTLVFTLSCSLIPIWLKPASELQQKLSVKQGRSWTMNQALKKFKHPTFCFLKCLQRLYLSAVC